MIDKSIEYKSIIMRCACVNGSAFCNLSEDIEIQYYKQGMEKIWIDIQKSVGAFENYSDVEIRDYFNDKFISKTNELERRCIFLKDIKNGIYVGTCCAWMGKKENEIVPVLHWLAVRNGYGSKKYARMLITEVMKIFGNLDYGKFIYLHTQPSAYKAIKLYSDFGFCIAKHDTYGTCENECDLALEILKVYMEPISFKKLLKSLVE